MGGVLCIDFGTSAIRAVRRSPRGKLEALAIGNVTKSRLDDASIRSEIHVDEDRRYVRYGERAFVARKDSRTPALYEASPKLWLKEPGRLRDEAAPGLGVTREQLLAGLLAYAVRAAAEADEIGESTLKSVDIRIAHPVWPAQVKTAADASLDRLCAQARQMAFQREWGTVTVTSLLEHVQASAKPRCRAVDVIEPLAAAVDLLEGAENEDRICAVIDVGAGTTDIGLFRCLVPDGMSQVHRKLYPLGPQVSLFKAGNALDAIVLGLLEARAKRRDAVALADVGARIRGIKETLLKTGLVQELGCDLRVGDLQSHEKAKSIATEIRAELLRLVQANEREIKGMLDRPHHSLRRLDVVMAGGGGGIGFLQQAIRERIQVAGKFLEVELATPRERAGIKLHGAARGRMAVALGGASVEYDALVHEQPPVTTIRRGSL